MTSKFANNVLKEINAFRANPKSLTHELELVRTGLSRLKQNDPFLGEIDNFVRELSKMKPMPQLQYNEVLSQAATAALPSWRGRASFKKYRREDDIKGIVPDYYMVASPALIADDGADEPVNVLTKVLLDKTDVIKQGRNIVIDPSFTQVGIGHEKFEDENMVILIFATEYVSDEPEYELPEGDLSELKKAFDILDTSGKQKLDMRQVMETMEQMEFEKTDPTLYSIFEELSNRDTCSWPKFAYFANARMTDRSTKEGLSTIFNLFIDNPDKNTITFQTFKKICDEIDCGLTEQQLKEILEASTANGNEITFKEFEEYMFQEDDGKNKPPKPEKQEKQEKKKTAKKGKKN